MKFRTLLLTLVAAVFVISACAPAAPAEPTVAEPMEEEVMEEAPEEEPMEEPEEEPGPGSIVDIAVADGRFTTLVTAVTEAGLAETLSGEGPFTVFAPTDDAFAALPEGTIEALLADIPALTDILLYHVADGKVMAAEVVGLDEVPTLQGSSVAISQDMDKVMANEAQIILTDIEASNGVIHVIDAVLLPEG